MHPKKYVVHLLHNAERGVEPPNVHSGSLLEASWLQQAKEYEDEGEESEDDEAETKNMRVRVRIVKKWMMMKITMCRQISEDVEGTHVAITHCSLTIYTQLIM